jgi:hypothetical protein
MPGSEAVFLDPPNDAQYKILWVPVPPLPRPKKQARMDLEGNWGCLTITKGSEDGWDDFHGGLKRGMAVQIRRAAPATEPRVPAR